jgi:hypothetical protein
MMKFILGALIGMGGYMAYKRGMLPQSFQGVFEKVSPTGSDSQIIRPTAHEVAERPSTPIPG